MVTAPSLRRTQAQRPAVSSLVALGILGRELSLCDQQYKKLNDPNVPPHGTLQVIRSSLLRALDAATALIEHEESQ